MAAAVDQISEAASAQPARSRARVAGDALATALLAAFFTAYDLIPQPPYGANPFRDMWHRHALVAAALLLWAAALIVRRRLPRPNLLLAPLLLLFCIEAAAAAASADWRIGLEPALDLLAAILIFWALTDSPGLSITSLRRALMLTALLLALVCLHFVWDRWLDWRNLTSLLPDAHSPLLPPTVPRVTGVGTNPNIVAPLMTLTAPLYLLALLHSTGRQRAGVALAAVVVQLAIFFTLARAAWIGEVAGLTATAVLLALSGRGVRLPLRWIALAAGAALVALACLAALTLVLGWRPLWLFRPSIAARSDFRGAAIEIVRRQPLLGAGPAGFALIYPYVSDGDPAGAVHSHNVLTEIAVETGLAGLFAAMLVGLVAATLIYRRWRAGDPAQRALLAGVAGAGVIFLVNGMADSLQLFPEVLFVLGALMAMALRCGSVGAGLKPARLTRKIDGSLGGPGRGKPRPYRAEAPTSLRLGSLGACVVAVIAVASAAGLLGLWLRIDQASAEYARSITLASQQRWSEAAAAAGRASAIDPNMPIYYVQAGLDRAIEAETIAPGDLAAQERTSRAQEAASVRGRAIADLARALALEPRSPVTRFDLALLLLNEGQIDRAIALLPDIVQGAPRDSLLLLGAGVIDEQQQPGRAIADYAAALAQSPRIADSTFWQETAFRSQNFPAIVRQALDRAGTEDSSGGPSATREIIEQASGLTLDPGEQRDSTDFTAQINLAQTLTAGHDYGRAVAILRRAVDERPDDPAARLALGELYAAIGDSSQAREQWLAGAYLGDAASISHLIDTWPAGRAPKPILQLGRQALTGLWLRQFALTQQHYRFAYRRQEPWPITLPSDALNALPKVYAELRDALQR
jgi:O-antigen ligase/tetratricopeptide (TPR) repeat protein